ncbi:YwmB family TATA-box binding protein [Anaerosporobacter faecicola]|uniref:YwmB family TATA-box binding protein n=1 Tax=Anaerosporobacter faecicola TaxID=2718714 RepID=UPI00143C3073|nr:YwmB family TATA-box binding protein [Anaerosporobacter faecicola]
MKEKEEVSFLQKTIRFLKQQNRKVKTIAYVSIVLWIAVISQIGVNRYFTDDSKLVDAFTKTNSAIMDSNLYMVADLGTDYMKEEDEKNLIQYMASKIGIDEDCKITKGEEQEVLYTKCVSDAATTIIKLIRNQEEEKDGVKMVRRYLIVDLTIKEDVNSILTYKKKAEKSAEGLEARDVESQVTFTGRYDGKLSMEERNQVTDQFLRNLQASIVLEQRGDELYTIYAYTGLIDDYIKSQGSKINVNLAFTYNEKKNTTKLYVATPILNQDY